MRRIPLRARDGSIRAHALVDDEDYEWVTAFTWSLHSQGYAYRQTGAGSGRRNVLLHRFILGLVAGDPRQGDHVNRDRLDCRRENLRVLSPGANGQNVGARGRSRFRGVSWSERRRRWIAQVEHAGRKIRAGQHRDELDAAIAASELRRRVMPFAEPDPELVKLGLA